MKFSTKLTLIVLIVTVVGITTIGTGVYIAVREMREETIKKNQLELARSAINQIDRVLFGAQQDIKLISMDRVLMDTLEGYLAGTEKADIWIDVNREFKDRIFFTGPWDELVITDKEGFIVSSSAGKIIGKDIRQYPASRTAFEAAMKGQNYYSDLVISALTDRPTVIFASPIKSETGKIVGVAIGQFAWPVIMQLLEDTPLSTHMHLLNKDGILIAEYTGTGAGGKILETDFSRNVLIKQARSEKRRSVGDIITMVEENVKVLGVYVSETGFLEYKGNGWGLLTEVPLDIAFEPLKKITQVFLIYVSIGIFIILGVFYFLGKRLTRPIEILTMAMKTMSAGNMDTRAEVKTSDEIGILAEAFNRMARDLKKSREDLENYSQNLEEKVGERTRELNVTLAELKENRDAVLSILEDTNEAKKKLEAAMEELKKTQQQLIQSGKLAGIGQIAAGVAHEINNPLTSIMGFAQLTMSRRDIDDTLRTDLSTIEKEAKRCITIIENLLNFARPQEPQKTEININNVIDAALKIMEYSITREKIDIVKKYTEALPLVLGDSYQLQQVFMNIILNAVHAMPRGGNLTISTRLQKTENREQIEIAFQDTGIGIPDDIKDKIFEPFFTTSYKSGYKGTGLGLSISYSIVQAHGGRIEVESAMGKGSTFRVILPLV